MEPGDREAFEVILAELFGALDKPLTEAKREGFWRGLAKMSIVQFARCRDVLLEELADGEPRKAFSVPDVWAAKNRSRARAPIEQPAEPPWSGDKWDIAANDHLMAHLMRRALGREGGYDAAQTAMLVQAKNAWAQDMRETEASDGPVDVETQRGMWAYRLQLATERMAAARLLPATVSA